MKVYTLTGCSAVGKDKILNELIKMNIGLIPIISTTSRPMRPHEIQGVEYNFVTKEQANIMKKNNDFIESRKYKVANGDIWIYGITKDSIDLNSNNNYIVIVDYNGLLELEDYLCNRGYTDSLTSIFIDCSFQTRLLRSLQREGKMDDEQVKEVIRRFEDDNKKVLLAKDYCDYVVNNDGIFANTINRVLDIIESEV
jgi:guanylate kinase